jgi:hypothetical protein
VYISVQIYHWTSNYINNNYVVTGANNIETHYVDTIPVTQEQPYDSISQRFQNYKTLLVMHSGMSYTFIRNKNVNGTIVGRIANQKKR